MEEANPYWKWYICGLGTGGGKIAREFLKTTMVEGLRIDAVGISWINYLYLPHLIGSSYKNNPEIVKEVEEIILPGKIEDTRTEGFERDFLRFGYLLSKAKKLGEDLAKQIYEKAKKDLTDCHSILFTVGFGGGTGTGLINSVSQHINGLQKEFQIPVYVLGTLPENCKNDAGGYSFEERCFSAACSIYELSKKAVVNALILVDNTILFERCLKIKREELKDYKVIEKDYEKMNKYIFNIIRLMIDPKRLDDTSKVDAAAVRHHITKDSHSPVPVLVPCYSDKQNKGVEDLLEDAINKGKWIDCNHKNADRVYVFTSDLNSTEEKIKKKLKEVEIKEERIIVWRTLGTPSKNEVLILLRFPLGGIFSTELPEVIDKAIKEANKKKEQQSLKDYSEYFRDVKKVTGYIDEVVNGLRNMEKEFS